MHARICLHGAYSVYKFCDGYIQGQAANIIKTACIEPNDRHTKKQLIRL